MVLDQHRSEAFTSDPHPRQPFSGKKMLDTQTKVYNKQLADRMARRLKILCPSNTNLCAELHSRLMTQTALSIF